MSNAESPTQADVSPPENALSVTELCAVLGHKRRQVAINEVAQSDDRVLPIKTLSRRVAASLYDCEPAQVGHTKYKRIYVSLYQTHLEQLADAGVFLVDDRTNEVQPGPSFQTAQQALDTLAAFVGVEA